MADEGIREPKPLVIVGGEKLIDRLIRIFSLNGAESITVICNDHSPEVAEHLLRVQNEGLNGCHIPLQLIVKSTPSSMHSFFEISPYLCEGPFVLTTVDTVFIESEFGSYLRAFHQALFEGQDGLMGVTTYIDDEKPLYVETGENMGINGFLDSNERGCKYVSAGIYGLTPKAIDILNDCERLGVHRMRNFQRELIGHGLRLRAYPFTKVIDIDHASDIRKAELLLQ